MSCIYFFIEIAIDPNPPAEGPEGKGGTPAKTAEATKGRNKTRLKKALPRTVDAVRIGEVPLLVREWRKAWLCKARTRKGHAPPA